MPSIIWKFSVAYLETARIGPTSTGIYLPKYDDVKRIAEISETSALTRESSIRMEVELEENCEQLQLILEELGNFGWEPAERRYVVGNSATVFGVERWRNYTEEELDDFEYVYLSFVKDRIAKFKRGGESNVANEDYVVKKGSENKNVPIGNLFPFRRFSINKDLKESLEKARVAGLKCEPVVNSGSIWKLSRAS